MAQEGRIWEGFVLIKTRPEETKSVVKSLRELKKVGDVAPVAGPFDVVARLQASSPEELNKVLIDEVRKVKGVTETTTLLRLE